MNVSDYCFESEAFSVIQDLIHFNLVNKSQFFTTNLLQMNDTQFNFVSSQISSTFPQLMRVQTIPTNDSYCSTVFAPSPFPTPAPTFPPRFSDANSNQNNLNTFSQLSSHPDITIALVLVVILFFLGSIIYIIISNREKPLITYENLIKRFYPPPPEMEEENVPAVAAVATGKDSFHYGEVLPGKVDQYFTTSPFSSGFGNRFHQRDNSISQEMFINPFYPHPGITAEDSAFYYPGYHPGYAPGYYPDTMNRSKPFLQGSQPVGIEFTELLSSDASGFRWSLCGSFICTATRFQSLFL